MGVLGASSLVGRYLLPRLLQAHWKVQAWSRVRREGHDSVQWHQLGAAAPEGSQVDSVPHWICLAPAWTLPAHLALLEAAGARRVVVLSSTSRFTKASSGDAAEVAVAQQLIDAEVRVGEWAALREIECVILRPTLIYGGGLDKNVSEIARFIRRAGFFPVLGKASGLRQPVRADDVAAACVAALTAAQPLQGAYDISGGEALSYRCMVERIFAALGRPVRILPVPLWTLRAAVALIRILPRCRHWSSGMAERMNRDQAFDHGDAGRDLGYAPGPFRPTAEDLTS